MEIANIRNYQNFSPPTFKSNCIEVFDDNQKLKYRTTTSFFREDIDWKWFSKFLAREFKNQEHVNVYNYACSDGSEPYTLAISMFETLSAADREKFFPIIAKDFDDFVLKKAQSGEFNIIKSDKSIFQFYGIDEDKYFDKLDEKDVQYPLEIPTWSIYTPVNQSKIKDEIKKSVDFSHANILKDIDNIDSEKPCVVLFRNAFQYLKGDELSDLIQKMGERMQENSILVIGESDLYNIKNTPSLLYNTGFSRVVPNIYQKDSSFKLENCKKNVFVNFANLS